MPESGLRGLVWRRNRPRFDGYVDNSTMGRAITMSSIMSTTLPPALLRLAQALTGRRALLLVALLMVLHLVVLLGPDSAVARLLFVAHLGLFILWQPFVRSDLRLSAAALAAVALVVGMAALWLNVWVLLVWITLLGGIVGGKVLLFETRRTKYFYLLALAYLVGALLFLALPAAVPEQINPRTTVTQLGRWLSPVVFLVMLLIPKPEESDSQPEVIDFIYSLLMVSLLGVLVLGSLAVTFMLRSTYAEALAATLLVIGVTLLVLGWAWDPHGNMGGIGTVFSRHLLSIGLPMEQWLHTLADLAHGQTDPEKFVAASCDEMIRRLSWVAGVSWTTASSSGSAGRLVGRNRSFRFHGLELAIYTRYPMNVALVWHFNLLAQLIAEFHADKQRARQLEHMSYLQAVHETGARLTHDTKNLLQVLKTLCTAAEAEGPEVSPAFADLLRRQLPAIRERLEQALGKLSEPQFEDARLTPVLIWWQNLQHRYASVPVEFSCEGDLAGVASVPAGLFDHVADNLLANALAKGPAGQVAIRVVLRHRGGAAELEVRDGGDPVPEAFKADLLRAPVPSDSGLGIGLYQSARLAGLFGYALALAANEPGHVSFRLAPVAA